MLISSKGKKDAIALINAEKTLLKFAHMHTHGAYQ